MIIFSQEMKMKKMEASNILLYSCMTFLSCLFHVFGERDIGTSDVSFRDSQAPIIQGSITQESLVKVFGKSC